MVVGRLARRPRRATSTARSRRAHRYELRVRARDVAGNWSSWAVAGRVGSASTQDTLDDARPVGLVAASANNVELLKWHGRHTRRPPAPRSPARSPAGRVAWVSAVGPTRGSARVFIDGALVSTISQYRADPGYRKVVFERSWVTSGTHTIRIEVVGTSGRPRVDLDALVVIR